MASVKLYFESMAGTHLEDALRALRDTGSADALYDHKLRSMDPTELDWSDVSVARDIAESGASPTRAGRSSSRRFRRRHTPTTSSSRSGAAARTERLCRHYRP